MNQKTKLGSCYSQHAQNFLVISCYCLAFHETTLEQDKLVAADKKCDIRSARRKKTRFSAKVQTKIYVD